MVVIGVSQALHRDAIPDRYAFKSLYAEGRAWINRGGSAIVDPEGRILAGPLFEKEGDPLRRVRARGSHRGALDPRRRRSLLASRRVRVRDQAPGGLRGPGERRRSSRSTARRAAKQRRAPRPGTRGAPASRLGSARGVESQGRREIEAQAVGQIAALAMECLEHEPAGGAAGLRPRQ